MTIESSLWNVDIVPAMAARYGLANTSNGPKTGPHDWGWELITADDEAKFLYEMSIDPVVGPLLMDAMANVAPTGADGFDQAFGLNSLTGDHGSKQGWTDRNHPSQSRSTRSAGPTVLRRHPADVDRPEYDTMREDSTRTAQAVLAAEGRGRPGPLETIRPEPALCPLRTPALPRPPRPLRAHRRPPARAGGPASASPGPTIAARCTRSQPGRSFLRRAAGGWPRHRRGGHGSVQALDRRLSTSGGLVATNIRAGSMIARDPASGPALSIVGGRDCTPSSRRRTRRA